MARRWNEIDWDEDRPTLADEIASRSLIEWEPVQVTAPALDEYLEQVAAAYSNGGYLFGRWRAVDYTDVTAWFMARNRAEEYHFLRNFFDNAVVREGLAELEIPQGPDTSGFESPLAGSLCLDGILAGVVVTGGAYHSYKGPHRAAKALAVAAVEALTQNRFEDFRVDVSRAPWTPWFHDIAWDHTYVLTDLANAEVTVLCITDTD